MLEPCSALLRPQCRSQSSANSRNRYRECVPHDVGHGTGVLCGNEAVLRPLTKVVPTQVSGTLLLFHRLCVFFLRRQGQQSLENTDPLNTCRPTLGWFPGTLRPWVGSQVNLPRKHQILHISPGSFQGLIACSSSSATFNSSSLSHPVVFPARLES